MENTTLPANEKYSLTINEAAHYFSIGVKKLRRMVEDNLDDFAVYYGNRYLIHCYSSIKTGILSSFLNEGYKAIYNLVIK